MARIVLGVSNIANLGVAGHTFTEVQYSNNRVLRVDGNPSGGLLAGGVKSAFVSDVPIAVTEDDTGSAKAPDGYELIPDVPDDVAKQLISEVYSDAEVLFDDIEYEVPLIDGCNADCQNSATVTRYVATELVRRASELGYETNPVPV